MVLAILGVTGLVFTIAAVVVVVVLLKKKK